MAKNIGTVDRIVRAAVGVAIIGAGVSMRQAQKISKKELDNRGRRVHITDRSSRD